MLKQTLWLLVTALMLLGLASCGEGAGAQSPEDVASSIVAATTDLENIDYEKLRANTTEASAEMINQMETQMKQMKEMLTTLPEEQQTQMKEMMEKAKTSFDKASMKCEVEGESATCTYCCNPATEQPEEVFLQQVDGKWLVDLTKG